jgi:hypothetical protein
MITPTVIEIRRDLEAVTCDPLIDGSHAATATRSAFAPPRAMPALVSDVSAA